MDDLLFLLLSPAAMLTSGAVCLGFMYCDLCVPSIAAKRLQCDKLPTLEGYMSMSRVLGVNFMVGGLLSVVVLYAFRAAGVHSEWPGFVALLIDVAMMAGLFDLWFYVVHRMMHTRWLYGRSHKLHHEWKAPVAFEGAYFDLLDFVVGNYGPMLFLPLAVSRSYCSIFAFCQLGVVSVAITHSGYDLAPLLGCLAPSIRHDSHHEFFNVNFSTFGVLDWLGGTYLSDTDIAHRRKAAAEKRGAT